MLAMFQIFSEHYADKSSHHVMFFYKIYKRKASVAQKLRNLFVIFKKSSKLKNLLGLQIKKLRISQGFLEFNVLVRKNKQQKKRFITKIIEIRKYLLPSSRSSQVVLISVKRRFIEQISLPWKIIKSQHCLKNKRNKVGADTNTHSPFNLMTSVSFTLS